VQEAQLRAEKSRYYLNVISHPSQPQTPERPRRLLWIAAILMATLILWGLLR
jgi:capsule polysaccharide export protein KpsE/RkpR